MSENANCQFGNEGLIGQELAKKRIDKIFTSGRISHAYLFSGPKGSGKKAFALGFAELINGISNLTDLGADRFSKKTSWFTHPDIHLFLPRPTKVSIEEITQRRQLLAKDPYEVVDFSLRPSLNQDNSSKNLKAFYPIKYFNNEIKAAARLKPNEGKKSVIIITNIEKMKKEAANAFLKLLEEPSENIVFLLTTDNQSALLPTIISRCQLFRMGPIATEDIEQALIKNDGYKSADAAYLARLSGGNYSLTKFYDIENLQLLREEIVEFLRRAYKQDANYIINKSTEWNNSKTRENQIALLNTMAVFIRDLYLYRETGNQQIITNYDQIEAIKKFTETLPEANLKKMLETIDELRQNLYQNVQGKIIFTVLGLRFHYLIHNKNLLITSKDSWKHSPAYID